MTNIELLNRRAALQQAANTFQTTKAKYAIQKNLGRVQSELEAYQETLQQIAEDKDPKTVEETLNAVLGQGNVPEEATEETVQDLTELLQQDAGTIEPYTVTEKVLDKEDDKGTDVPFQIVMALDFMIEEA